jgi:hypothetical protein
MREIEYPQCALPFASRALKLDDRVVDRFQLLLWDLEKQNHKALSLGFEAARFVCRALI